MLKEAIDRLVDLVKGSEVIQVIGDTARETRKVTVGPNAKEYVLKKDVHERGHTFDTVEGLVDYLSGPFAKEDRGPVFVQAADVLVPLQYQGSHLKHTASLPLKPSEEYEALQELFGEIGQKDLWRLLITKLAGCLPPELQLIISGIRIENKGSLEVKIDTSGVTGRAATSGYHIQYNDAKGGPQSVTIPLDYVARVRIWECFSEVFEIPLRLEIDADGGVISFQFHPRRLEGIVREARAKFVEFLAERVKEAKIDDRFQVLEGRE